MSKSKSQVWNIVKISTLNLILRVRHKHFFVNHLVSNISEIRSIEQWIYLESIHQGGCWHNAFDPQKHVTARERVVERRMKVCEGALALRESRWKKSCCASFWPFWCRACSSSWLIGCWGDSYHRDCHLLHVGVLQLLVHLAYLVIKYYNILTFMLKRSLLSRQFNSILHIHKEPITPLLQRVCSHAQWW